MNDRDQPTTSPPCPSPADPTTTSRRRRLARYLVLGLPLWAPPVLLPALLLLVDDKTFGSLYAPVYLALPALGFMPVFLSRRLSFSSKAVLFFFYYPAAFVAGLICLVLVLSLFIEPFS